MPPSSPGIRTFPGAPGRARFEELPVGCPRPWWPRRTGGGPVRPLRQQQFALVRVCARRTLYRLGVPAVPVVPNRHGAPQPDGILRSMTLCDRYRAAAVAP
ncbi:hypothetical protein [Streptomyces atroolivaceus]|uniref:hypothetical protein n=1 Tax=Streptomyces atroolivaceus TaxID=66869 RepID=UPI003D685D45